MDYLGDKFSLITNIARRGDKDLKHLRNVGHAVAYCYMACSPQSNVEWAHNPAMTSAWTPVRPVLSTPDVPDACPIEQPARVSQGY